MLQISSPLADRVSHLFKYKVLIGFALDPPEVDSHNRLRICSNSYV